MSQDSVNESVPERVGGLAVQQRGAIRTAGKAGGNGARGTCAAFSRNICRSKRVKRRTFCYSAGSLQRRRGKSMLGEGGRLVLLVGQSLIPYPHTLKDIFQNGK